MLGALTSNRPYKTLSGPKRTGSSLTSKGSTFIDSDGLGTILKASRRLTNDGKRLQVTRGMGQPADMFRLTGLDRAVPLIDPLALPADAPGVRARAPK